MQAISMQALCKITAVFGLGLLLTACGGGGGGGGNSSGAGSSSAADTSGSASASTSSQPTTNTGGGTSSSPASVPKNTGPVSAASYRVQLMWSAPSTRADGSPLPLSELSGYRIYYLLDGTDPSNDSMVSVKGGSTTSLSMTLTTAGAYTFAITAVDQNGLESSLSNPVSIPIN